MLSSIYFEIKWCAQFIMYFGIKWPFSVKMNLKGPLSRDSQFKSHFYLGWQGNRGSSQSFHAASFSRDCRSIIPNYETIQWKQNAWQCEHDSKQNDKITGWEICMARDY